MKTSDLYTNEMDCCGCEACASTCPRNIIQMKSDDCGFLYPHIISEELCINCKRCLKVCPVKTSGRQGISLLNCYGGHLNDIDQIKSSSSGAVAFGIYQEFLKVNKNGVVYGVIYNSDYSDVLFERASSPSELVKFKSSKYVQARKNDVYKSISKDLADEKKVLFVGLPCEVSALYHTLGRKTINLYTVSLICHGPTSLKVHNEYCTNLKKQFKSEIHQFNLRYKLNGWKPYYIHAEFNNGDVFNEKFATSDYDIAFKYLKRPSCHNCQYKLGNKAFGIVSDIILGDFHAVQLNDSCYNNWGTSEILVNTPKGQELVELIKPYATMQSLPLNRITTGNIALYQSTPLPRYSTVFRLRFSSKGLKFAAKTFQIRFEIAKKYYTKQFRLYLTKIIKSLKTYI